MSKLVINKYSVDKKELSVIFTFLCWLILGFIIIFMGVNNVFAASYNADNFTAQIYDNVNGSLTAKTTTKESSGTTYYYSYDVGYTAYSSGGAWGVSSPIPLLANHTYSMTVDPMVIGCGFTILSTVNRLGVGNSLGNAVTSYQNNTNVNEKFSQAISNSRYLQYVFTPTVNATYIVFPYSTTSTCSGRETQLTTIVIEDLGETGVSQQQINTSLNNQTNEINNSIQNSTDTIINNQNQNNEELKDTINENFNSCRDKIPHLKNKLNASMFYNNATGKIQIEYQENLYVYIYEVEEFGNYTFNFLNYNRLRIYTSDILYTQSDLPVNVPGSMIINNDNPSINETFTINVDKKYIYMYLSGDSNIQGEIQFNSNGEICTNKIDETNDKLNDLNSSLNDSNVDGSLGNAGSFFDNFTTTDHGGLSGIITAPLVAINQMLNTSCNPMTTTFKGKELSLPCGYEFWNKMGPIQDFVNLVLGGLLCYQIIIKLYKLIEKIKNPEDDRLEVMDL